MINKKIKKITMDNSRKRYTNINEDITIIEIKSDDKINYYLDLDKEDKDKYKKKSAYILHYPEGKLKVSYGKIKWLKNNNIICHICSTEKGSSGSPILSLETFKVIGVHFGADKTNLFNYGKLFKNIIDEFNKNYNKNEINLIYISEKEGEENIFGEKFVENNKNKIELIINGIKNNLVNKCKMKKGENNITMIIKNKITNLEEMFSSCNTLKDINELENLDTKGINNISCMFYGCSSLSDIKSLENWDVSNSNNFNSMFKGCSKNFNGMFYGCSSLSDIKPLENWNVSNSNDFSCMFYRCSSLSDIKSLENWNVSNSNNFNGMFYGCSSLSDIKSLENWNVSNSIFDSMFNNPSINSNNIDNEIKNKNYINRKYKKNKLLTNYEKMKKPFVPIKKSKSNFNKIYPDLFLTPLKDDSKKDNEKTETKNLVANTPLLNNNRLYGLYRKYRSGNTKVSSNNNIISNNKSFEENCPSKANNNGLNTTKIIQFKERGNPNKITLRKYNNGISEDFRFSIGKKK